MSVRVAPSTSPGRSSGATGGSSHADARRLQDVIDALTQSLTNAEREKMSLLDLVEGQEENTNIMVQLRDRVGALEAQNADLAQQNAALKEDLAAAEAKAAEREKTRRQALEAQFLEQVAELKGQLATRTRQLTDLSTVLHSVQERNRQMSEMMCANVTKEQDATKAKLAVTPPNAAESRNDTPVVLLAGHSLPPQQQRRGSLGSSSSQKEGSVRSPGGRRRLPSDTANFAQADSEALGGGSNSQLAPPSTLEDSSHSMGLADFAHLIVSSETIASAHSLAVSGVSPTRSPRDELLDAGEAKDFNPNEHSTRSPPLPHTDTGTYEPDPAGGSHSGPDSVATPPSRFGSDRTLAGGSNTTRPPNNGGGLTLSAGEEMDAGEATLGHSGLLDTHLGLGDGSGGLEDSAEGSMGSSVSSQGVFS